MRISDWSSDVCSSDLHEEGVFFQGAGKPGLCRCDVSLAALVELGLFYCYIQGVGPRIDMDDVAIADQAYGAAGRRFRADIAHAKDRQEVVWVRSVSSRVGIGGGRIVKKKKKYRRT